MNKLKLIFLCFLATSLSGCREYTPEDTEKAKSYCTKYNLEFQIHTGPISGNVSGYSCKIPEKSTWYGVPESVLK